MAKVIYRLPVIIFICVAFSQIVLTKTANLTPWRGGGFGMFSTHNSHQDRTLLILGKDFSDKTYKILVSKQALKDKGFDESTVSRITAMPTSGSLEAFSKKLLSWDYVSAGRDQQDILKNVKDQNGDHISFKDFGKESQVFLRPVQSRDDIPKTHTIRRLKAVQLSLWVLSLDREKNHVYWKPLIKSDHS